MTPTTLRVDDAILELKQFVDALRLIDPMAEEGDCDPQLFESLKAMQLVLDRQLRAMNRDGVTPAVMKGLPEIPDEFE